MYSLIFIVYIIIEYYMNTIYLNGFCNKIHSILEYNKYTALYEKHTKKMRFMREHSNVIPRCGSEPFLVSNCDQINFIIKFYKFKNDQIVFPLFFCS